MFRVLFKKSMRHRSRIMIIVIILTILLFIQVNVFNTDQQKRSVAALSTSNYILQNVEMMAGNSSPTPSTAMPINNITQNMQKTVISLNNSATNGNKAGQNITQKIQSTPSNSVTNGNKTGQNVTQKMQSTPSNSVTNGNKTGQNITQKIQSTSSQFKQTPKDYRKGFVNVHLWYKMCTLSFDGIRQHPLFPLWPSVRGQPEMPDELESITTALWSVQRVMGLLYPPITGRYSFKIFSGGSLSEFWLSSSSNPEDATLMARNNKNVVNTIDFIQGKIMSTSKLVLLKQGQTYYFEILHGRNNQFDGQKVRVQWMLPGNRTFTGIPKKALSTVIKVDNNHDVNTRELLSGSASLVVQNSLSIKPKQHQWVNDDFKTSLYNTFNSDDLRMMEVANNWKIMSAFDYCDYKPSYTERRNYKRYEGVYNTHYSDVFPDDGTAYKYWENNPFITTHHSGNTLIEEDVVIDIVNKFMAKLEMYFPGEYTLANVIKIERNVDKKRGNRFFLDLVLREVNTRQFQRLSQYFYQLKKDPNHLCKPKRFNWSPKVKINCILTAKNQGPWVIHYIKNMAEIVHATGDDNVHFIVVDYGNNGVDVAGEFKRNNVTSFTIIKKTGKFHKTLAIDEAAKTIKDDNSIVFLNDLHLTAPQNLFENVRKHTIKGMMAFTPITFRLAHCSRPETEQTPIAHGFWESLGFGIISTYKSDWNNFGGVNVKEFKYKWGGEDWEMVDRVLSKGIEIELLRLPYFYHFYHDKVGMWS